MLKNQMVLIQSRTEFYMLFVVTGQVKPIFFNFAKLFIPTTHVFRFGEKPTTHVIRFGRTPMTHIIEKPPWCSG